jgi:hypothetical protein
MATVLYTHLPYEDYKNLETQMRKFAETTHTSTGGFYHKSIRLVINRDTIMEFHGPLVGGYGHGESEPAKQPRGEHAAGPGEENDIAS